MDIFSKWLILYLSYWSQFWVTTCPFKRVISMWRVRCWEWKEPFKGNSKLVFSSFFKICVCTCAFTEWLAFIKIMNVKLKIKIIFFYLIIIVITLVPLWAWVCAELRNNEKINTQLRVDHHYYRHHDHKDVFVMSHVYNMLGKRANFEFLFVLKTCIFSFKMTKSSQVQLIPTLVDWQWQYFMKYEHFLLLQPVKMEKSAFVEP